jgi:hypothetical protein
MRDVAELGPLASIANSFTRVAGYTSFGDFILVDPVTGEHAILLTMTVELESTGFNDPAEFRGVFLSNADIVEQVGKPALVAELEKRLGPLGTDEVYFPVPYPFLGGSGSTETFDKGNVWKFANVVGQSQGLAMRPRA